MKNIMAHRAIRDIICIVTLILPIYCGIGMLFSLFKIDRNKDNSLIAYQNVDKTQNIILLDINKDYCDISCFLYENDDTISFIAKTFGVDKSLIYEDLINRNDKLNYSINNIGALVDKNNELKDYSSFEKGLIEYMYDYAKKNPKNVSKEYVPYEGSAPYIIDLFRYFTNIYDNVDYLTAVSIAAHESGYYKVKYMLKYNNVYGGMSSSGLIKHKNMEYGILSYIRMLSIYYYGKGLNTLESIGRVYCPVKENGKNIARPSWVKNVKLAMNYYKDSYESVSVTKLLNYGV